MLSRIEFTVCRFLDVLPKPLRNCKNVRRICSRTSRLTSQMQTGSLRKGRCKNSYMAPSSGGRGIILSTVLLTNTCCCGDHGPEDLGRSKRVNALCESVISSAISSFSLHGYQSPLYTPFLVYPVSQPLSSSVSLSLSLCSLC